MVAALHHLSPSAGQWITALHETDERLTGPHSARLREERDAVSLAIDISGVPAPDDLLYTPGDGLNPGEAFGATLNPLYLIDNPLSVADNENDLLAADLRRFDPHGQLQMRSSSIARFTDDQFALTITNVNRKPLEKALGVDLIYYDELAHIFTLVQYKRMTLRATGRDKSAERWAYTAQAELEEQLQRMDIGLNEPVNSQDWRMVPSPFWFKFVRDLDFTPGDPFVLKGMYVPADYLQRAIADGSLRTGPRTGFEVTYGNTRYLPREVFVALCAAGSRAPGRDGGAIVAAGARDHVVDVLQFLGCAGPADNRRPRPNRDKVLLGVGSLDPFDQALGEVAEQPELVGAEPVDDEPAHFAHMAGSGRGKLAVAEVGERRDGEATVGLVGRAAYVAPCLQSLDQVGEARERGAGQLGEHAHPELAVGLFGEPGEHVVLHEAQFGVVLQLSL